VPSNPAAIRGTTVAVDDRREIVMIEIRRILCPIDFSGYSEHALIYAMRMAAWHGAQLQVMHVMPPLPPGTTSALADSCRDMTAHNLTAAVNRQRLAGVDVTTELIESADPAARIIECADSHDIDLVVTGSHGRTGVERVLLGSVVEALLHRCHRPVLAIPSHLDEWRTAVPISFGRIVCAVDFAAASMNALAYAIAIAEESDARLTMLHVIDVPPELRPPPEPADCTVDRIRSAAEADCLQRLRGLVPDEARDYCTIETAVVEGGVSRQLLRMAFAASADLIVLGVHGRNAFDLAFFGSTSKDVIRQSRCPVLIVPAGRRIAMRAAS
jgi:nucleotide-binding universal stress UspA family protein